MALSTGKCLENAMCKVDLPFIVSFQRFLLDFFVDSYQVLSIHLREEERNYALNKVWYFPFSSLSASPTSIVRPWWLTSRSSSFLKNREWQKDKRKPKNSILTRDRSENGRKILAIKILRKSAKPLKVGLFSLADSLTHLVGNGWNIIFRTLK